MIHNTLNFHRGHKKKYTIFYRNLLIETMNQIYSTATLQKTGYIFNLMTTKEKGKSFITKDEKSLSHLFC